jgi:hypothetical protein
MTAVAYQTIISAALGERRDLFLATANRLGAPLGNIEGFLGLLDAQPALPRTAARRPSPPLQSG